MNRLLAIAVVGLAAFAAGARAQDGASTLTANLADADAVVVARVLAVQEGAPGALVAAFRVDRTLAGAAPAGFTLAEPAGACCGRSLFALQPGADVLAFLRRSGPAWHLVGGPRGVAPALPALVAHVAALAAASSDDARRALLLASLRHDEARIADDAALALANARESRLDAAAAAAVGDALHAALDRRAGRAAPLLDIAMRAGDAALRDAALARYLQAADDGEAAILRQGLLRATVAGTVELALAAADEERSGLRAAELVAALPAERAVPAGHALLQQTRHARVQLRACQDLMRRGVPDSQLAAPSRVVEAARKLLAARSPYRVLPPEVR